MSKISIKPIWFQEVTEILKGSEKEKPIPVHIDGKYHVTKWKLSLLQRFKLVVKGNFYITVKANDMPLITATIEKPIT